MQGVEWKSSCSTISTIVHCFLLWNCHQKDKSGDPIVKCGNPRLCVGSCAPLPSTGDKTLESSEIMEHFERQRGNCWMSAGETWTFDVRGTTQNPTAKVSSFYCKTILTPPRMKKYMAQKKTMMSASLFSYSELSEIDNNNVLHKPVKCEFF